MNWTDEEMDDVWQAFIDDYAATWDGDEMRSVIETPLRGAIKRALEIAQALGGTLTGETVNEVLDFVSARGPTNGDLPNTGKALRDHITAQGATVATLQAKVAELEKERNGFAAEMRTHRAEVERLKAITSAVEASVVATVGGRVDGGPTNKANYLQRLRELVATESRLAAIRERGNSLAGVHKRAEASWVGVKDWDDACHRDVRAAGAVPYLHHAAEGVARWVLEGDAPNSPETPDGSSNPSTTSNGSSTMTPDQQHEDLQRLTGAGPQEPPCPHENPTFTLRGCGQCHADRPIPLAIRHPCSPTCTHDDAASPGHPERLRERSEAVNKDLDDAITRDALMGDGYENGAEAMRAACLIAVDVIATREGLSTAQRAALQAAIEGTAP